MDESLLAEHPGAARARARSLAATLRERTLPWGELPRAPTADAADDLGPEPHPRRRELLRAATWPLVIAAVGAVVVVLARASLPGLVLTLAIGALLAVVAAVAVRRVARARTGGTDDASDARGPVTTRAAAAPVAIDEPIAPSTIADPIAREAAAAALVADDGARAAALVGRAGERYDVAVADALAAGGERRRQGLIAATAGGDPSVAAVLAALTAGERDAARAIASLDDVSGRNLHAELPLLAPAQRAAIARARVAASAPGRLLSTLAEDDDDEVRAAALAALAHHARAGRTPTPDLGTRLVERERAAVVALTAARPAVTEAPALHVAEVGRALRAARERLRLALELAGDGAATDPRTRAALARARRPSPGADRRAHALIDPWLAALLAGEHAVREPALAALRACRVFATLPGRDADDLAARAGRRFLIAGDVLVRGGAPGDTMFVVMSGALAVDGDRTSLGPGRIVSELALITDASPAATVRSTTLTEVLALDRSTFDAARARWPELGEALCHSLEEALASGPTARAAGRVER